MRVAWSESGRTAPVVFSSCSTSSCTSTESAIACSSSSSTLRNLLIGSPRSAASASARAPFLCAFSFSRAVLFASTVSVRLKRYLICCSLPLRQMQLIVVPERTAKQRKNAVYYSFRAAVVAMALSSGILSAVANGRANPPLDIDLQHSARGLGLESVFLCLCSDVGGFRALKLPRWLVHLAEGGVLQRLEAASFHLLLLPCHRQDQNVCLARAPGWPKSIDAFAVGIHGGSTHQWIGAHSDARASYQRAVESFELSVFFALVDVLSQAVGYVEARHASSVTRSQHLHESLR